MQAGGVDRQGHVQALGGEARVEGGLFQRGLADPQCLGHRLAQAVDLRPFDLAFLGAHLAQRLQQLGDAALLAQRVDADRLQRVQRGRIGDGGEQRLTHLFEFVTHMSLRRPFWRPREGAWPVGGIAPAVAAGWPWDQSFTHGPRP